MFQVATSEDQVPKRVLNLLLEGERNIFAIRRHPTVLASRVFVTIGGLAAAINASVIFGWHPAAFTCWAMVTYLLVDLILTLARWAVSYIVLTDQRIMVVGGMGGDLVESFPLSGLNDVRIQRSYAGLMFGYGTLDIDRKSFDYIPYPNAVCKDFNGAISVLNRKN